MPIIERPFDPNGSYSNLTAAAFHDEPLTFHTWKGVRYFIFGEEICPETGKAHLQFYVEFKSPKLGKAIKNRYPKLHISSRMKTQENCIAYCKKDGKFTEIGEKAEQGKRTDLTEVCLQVRTGVITLDDVLCADPQLYHKYGRTLKACEDFFFRTVKRTEMTTCEWLVGPTGCGKSHKAYTEHPDAYDYPYDNSEWCDGYRGQETMIINDFRGQIPYSTLLRLIDKWPTTVRVRGSQPRPFTSKHIVITSTKSPTQIYHNLAAEDSIDQLLRRITVKKMTVKSRSDLGV